MVLQVLLNNQLYAKESKCKFGVKEVEYLGHIVSAEGVSVDQGKVQAILPAPKNLKSLRRFLGLIGYYRKFVRGYSTLAAPHHSYKEKCISVGW